MFRGFHFIPAETEKKIWSRFCAIRFFLSWLSCYAFSCCTFLRSKSGVYTCAFFVLAPDGPKKCTPIPAHIHRKCTGIYVNFLKPGKARLPEPKPSRLSWLLPMPSVIRSHSGNCVLRRSGRSLVNKRDALPLVSSSLSLYCAIFHTYRRIKGKHKWQATLDPS